MLWTIWVNKKENILVDYTKILRLTLIVLKCDRGNRTNLCSDIRWLERKR